MDKRFWLERWEKNETGFHLDRRHHYLPSFYPRLELARGDKIFVPMCGKSPDLVWLHRQGAHVVGVELSPVAVAAFFAENDLDCRIGASDALQHYTASGYDLYCGDLFALRPAQLLGARTVYDRAALVALPPAMRAAYAAKLAELLPPASRVLLVSYSYDQAEISGPPFAVPLPEIEELFGADFTIEPLVATDVLWSHPVLEERGLTALEETAVLLVRR